MKMVNTMSKTLKQRFCLILALLLIVFTVSAAAEEKNDVETWLALAQEAHDQKDNETSFRYYEQAAKIYSRMRLLYPEKSAYFASLIGKLKSDN